MKDFEGKVFVIGGFYVIFKFEEFFNDMKMLVILVGELFNFVCYFFIFVIVLIEDYRDLEG